MKMFKLNCTKLWGEMRGLISKSVISLLLLYVRGNDFFGHKQLQDSSTFIRNLSIFFWQSESMYLN